MLNVIVAFLETPTGLNSAIAILAIVVTAILDRTLFKTKDDKEKNKRRLKLLAKITEVVLDEVDLGLKEKVLRGVLGELNLLPESTEDIEEVISEELEEIKN